MQMYKTQFNEVLAMLVIELAQQSVESAPTSPELGNDSEMV